jgi:hypothetical protein
LRPFRIKNLRQQLVHGFSLQSSSRTPEQITLFAVPQALNCSASKDRPIDTTPCLANHYRDRIPRSIWTAICWPRPRRQWRNRSPWHSAGRRARGPDGTCFPAVARQSSYATRLARRLRFLGVFTNKLGTSGNPASYSTCSGHLAPLLRRSETPAPARPTLGPFLLRRIGFSQNLIGNPSQRSAACSS